MTIRSNPTTRFDQLLLQRKWWIVACVTLPMLIAEVVEHRFHLIGALDYELMVEALVFCVACPVLFGQVLPRLASHRSNWLSVQLLKRRWEVMAFIGLAIVAGEFADHWTGSLSNLDPELLPEILAYGIALPLLGGILLTAHAHSQSSEVYQQSMPRRWAVMLLSGLVATAVELIVHRPASLQNLPSDTVTGILAIGVALPLLCGALLAELLHPKLESATAIIKDQAVEDERRRIARDLHDSVGQNLGYLRLRLAQLTGDEAMQEIATIRRELAHMSNLVDSTYEQLRGKLVDLHPTSSIDLVTTLSGYAETVGRRSNLQVELASQGQPRSLPSIVQREVLLLFREALINVEKHAQAKRVDIELAWRDDGLTICFSDDGRGFEPDAVQSSGHLGLVIMQERARAINGNLTVASHAEAGTQLKLWLPFDDAVPSAASHTRLS